MKEYPESATEIQKPSQVTLSLIQTTDFYRKTKTEFSLLTLAFHLILSSDNQYNKEDTRKRPVSLTSILKKVTEKSLLVTRRTQRVAISGAKSSLLEVSNEKNTPGIYSEYRPV